MVRRGVDAVRDFLTARTHPLNLAIFRIVLFATLFSSVNLGNLVWLSQVPAPLRVAPRPFISHLLPQLPITELSVRVGYAIFAIACVAAIIGLFTRISAVLALLSGFYLLTIVQFFGKIDHLHHLLWFAAILVVSPCAEVCSCDAAIAAWRRAGRETAPSAPGRPISAFPLRVVWILMGVVYFFPGFWKARVGGPGWAFSDNMKYQLYAKWQELDGWLPFFRIDHYPILYKLAALATISFELSFIVLVLFPRTRLFLAVPAGMIFHTMTYVFMRISFLNLQVCYVALLDWDAIFRRVGRRLYREPLALVYDGGLQSCRRIVAVLRVFDILGRVEYIDLRERRALAGDDVERLDTTALRDKIQIVVCHTSKPGLPGFRALAARIPVLWPVLPLTYLRPLSWLACRIFSAAVAVRPAGRTAAPLRPGATKAPSPRLAPGVVAVGSFLIAVNALVGFRGATTWWPFACYPTFASTPRPETDELAVSAWTSTGEVLPVSYTIAKQEFSSDRWQAVIGRIVNEQDPAQQRILLDAFWQLLVRNDASLTAADEVQISRVTLSRIPEQRQANPIRTEILLDTRLTRAK